MTGMAELRRLWLLCAGVLTAGVLLAGCGGGDSAPPGERPGIRVGSFDFIESELLAELYATALERRGFPVSRQVGLGPREVVVPALEQGLIDLVPEYAGSATRFLTGAAPPERIRPALEVALTARRLVPLAFAPAQDQNGVVMTAARVRESGLRRVSDLRPLAERLSFGGPAECPQRPLCLLGLQERYGLDFAAFVPHASRAETAEGLLAGTIDVGMLDTTDPYLADGRLVLLADDRGLQPPENVVPVVRQAALDQHGPALAAVIDLVSATLTTGALVELNRRVLLGQEPIAQVAATWLDDHTTSSQPS